MHEPEVSIPRSAETIFSVSELTRQIKRLLEGTFGEVWVEGELSNVKLHTSGHLYFSIKDETSSLGGVMFRARASRLRFEPRDGTKVRVQGAVTIYEPQSRYQINANAIEPVGIGELELAFRQLYERLEKEGLFDAARKRTLPRFPSVVGIVTSETGAAIRDLLSVLGRRAPHVRIVVRPARVQGNGAAEDIVRGIEELDEWGGADVIIIGRGGGSIEDLWAFNEEIVARAIRACRVPVVSAVGHEIDFTIADFAADVRAATPSAAAELVAPERDAQLLALDRAGGRLARALVQGLRARRDRVMLLARAGAFRRPLELYRRRSQEVDVLGERLQGAAHVTAERARLRLASLGGRLGALSPLAVLGRGYALVWNAAGELLRAATDARAGERVRLRLASGSLRCTAEEILEEAEAARLDPWTRKDAERR